MGRGPALRRESPTGEGRSGGQSGPSALLVVGGEDVQRQVFRDQGHGYWSAAFGTVLEKQGVLDFDLAGPEILADPANLAGIDLLFLAALPDGFWRPEYTETIRTFPGLTLMEGPIPPELSDWLGLSPPAGAASGQGLSLRVREPGLAAALGGYFPENLKPGGFYTFFEEKKVKAEPTESEIAAHLRSWLSKVRLGDLSGPQLDLFPHNLSFFLCHKLQSRLRSGNGLKGLERELSLLAWIEFIGRLEQCMLAGLLRERAAEFLEREDVCPGPDAAVERLAAWGLVLCRAGRVLGRPGFEGLARDVYSGLSSRVGRGQGSPIESAWTARLGADLGLFSGPEFSAMLAPALDSLKAGPGPGKGFWSRLFGAGSGGEQGEGPLLAWLLAGIAGEADSPPEWLDSLERAVERLAEDRASFSGRVAHALLLGAACRILGMEDKGRELYALALADGFDPEQPDFLRKTGRNPEDYPLAALCLVQAVSKFDLRFKKQALSGRGYTDEQVRAWKAAPFAVKAYDAPGAEVPVTFVEHESGREYPAAVRKNNLVCFTFEIFSYLVHFHTMHPLEYSFHVCQSAVMAHRCEVMFFLLLEREARRAGLARLTVGHWPWGRDFCLGIRHDVDRIPDEKTFIALLDFELAAGIGASWYWLPDRLDRGELARLAREGCEIGLHAVKLEGKRGELDAVLAACPKGTEITGECSHGGGDGDNWLGHLSIREAVRAGLEYTEGPPMGGLPFFGLPVLNPDGTLAREEITLMTRPVGLDWTLKSREEVVRRGWELMSKGFHCLLLNHPDLNLDRVKETVSILNEKNPAHMNCCEAARWRGATHRRDCLRISRARGAGLEWEIVSTRPVKDLELRLAAPDLDGFRAAVEAGGGWFEPEQGAVEMDGLSYLRLRLDLEPGVRLRLCFRRD